MHYGFTMLILLATLSLAGGCNAVPLPSAGPGFVFTDVQEGVAVGDAEPESEGRATHHNILGLVSVGDSSIAAAKADGDITHVSTVDREMWSILGVYSRSTLVIRGE